MKTPLQIQLDQEEHAALKAWESAATTMSSATV